MLPVANTTLVPILPTLALPDTDNAVNVPMLVICDCELLTLNEVPVNVNPVPAVYEPAPLNCVNMIGVVPIVAPLLLVHTQPVSALTAPVSTNVNAETISDGVSKSFERVNTYAVPAVPAVVTT